MKYQNYLYSESGFPISSNTKKEDILKPQLPKVLAEHEAKKKEFVPEVKQVGQNFWDNLYNQPAFPPQNYQANINIPNKNVNFNAASKPKEAPVNFENKYSTLGNIALSSKKEKNLKKEKDSGK